MAVDVEDLARRVQRIEDELAIQDLQNSYHALGCEQDYKAMTLLFTRDAEVDYGPWGKHKGHAEIEPFIYKSIADPAWVPYTKQFLQNPRYVLNEDGRTGTGRRYLFSTVVWQGKSTVANARFDDEYVKLDGRWFFSKTTIEVYFWTPIEDGWADQVSNGMHLGSVEEHMRS